eukprot:7738313-Heterocapsa_arctica.AAC.1
MSTSVLQCLAMSTCVPLGLHLCYNVPLLGLHLYYFRAGVPGGAAPPPAPGAPPPGSAPPP